MFKKAERKRVYLKLGMMGPSGSGKTYSAIQLAKGLAQGGPIAGIDTENGSMSLYAHLTDFDVVDLASPFHPKKAIDAIDEAVKAGYKVLIIDSSSHFWKEILSIKESLDRQGGNSYTNWGKVKPLYDALKDKMLQAPIHIISCMRAKDEYVLEKNEKGKDAPKKVGMGAINEPGAEYEYTTVFEIGMDHSASASKDRTGMFDGEVFRIDPTTGERFLEWLDGGVGELTVLAPKPPLSAQSSEVLDAGAYLKSIGADLVKFNDFKAAYPDGKWVECAIAGKQAGCNSLEALYSFLAQAPESIPA